MAIFYFVKNLCSVRNCTDNNFLVLKISVFSIVHRSWRECFIDMLVTVSTKTCFYAGEGVCMCDSTVNMWEFKNCTPMNTRATPLSIKRLQRLLFRLVESGVIENHVMQGKKCIFSTGRICIILKYLPNSRSKMFW